MLRWGHTPLWEADNAGHKHVLGFLQSWIVKDGNGETLTAAGGKELLQKIKDIELAAVKESPTSPKEVTEEAKLWAKPDNTSKKQ